MTESTAQNDEISLLDLLVVIAESWWIIVGGSVFAGAITYFAATSPPTVYSSTAVLAAPPAQIETMLADLGIQENFETRASSKNTAITSSAPSAERAEATLVEFVDNAVAQLAATTLTPANARMEALTKRLSEIEALAGQADDVLAGWQGLPDPDEMAIVSMLQLLQQLQAERFTVQEKSRLLAVEIVTLPQAMVVVPPGPAEGVSGRSPLSLAVLAALGAGFVLLVLAFLRQGLTQSAGNPESNAKLQRIKNALLFRRTTARKPHRRQSE